MKEDQGSIKEGLSAISEKKEKDIMKYLLPIILCLGLSLQAYAKNEGTHDNKHRDDYSDYHEYDRDDDVPPGLRKDKGRPGSLPPGLQKKYERTGELPPGWQKKLRRGAILDDELYEYGTTVVIEDDGYDYGIEETPGTEILRLEDRIIRITEDTREILEILGVGNSY